MAALKSAGEDKSFSTLHDTEVKLLPNTWKCELELLVLYVQDHHETLPEDWGFVYQSLSLLIPAYSAASLSCKKLSMKLYHSLHYPQCFRT